jgi:hypothetical protein
MSDSHERTLTHNRCYSAGRSLCCPWNKRFCDLATRLLPTQAERASILGRDTHETMLPNLATQTHSFSSIRRVTLADDAGNPFTIDASKALYDQPVSDLIMDGISLIASRPVLFGKPVGLEITKAPLVDLGEFPALNRTTLK